jgi:uncharacterized protein YjbI with pentapeptide repeats
MPLASGFCIFHDKDYLQDKTNNEEHKRTVLNRLRRKVTYAISDNEPLLCIGFQLPGFSLSDYNISKPFTKPVYFNGSQFYGKADFFKANFQLRALFSEANFKGEAFFYGTKFQERADFNKAEFNNKAYFSGAKYFSEAYFYGARFSDKANFLKSQFNEWANFSDATFYAEADFSETKFNNKAYFFKVRYFSEANFLKAEFSNEVHFSTAKFSMEVNFSGHFNDKTKFNYVLFEGKEKVIFDIENLSNVSFMNTDITGVIFSDKARWGEKKVEYDKFWGGQKVKEDRFKIVEERLLQKEIKEKDSHTTKDFSLGSIKAVYRNLRENYEYRMRFDEAGQFFVREMELKRKYREVVSKEEEERLGIKQNNWFRRNLFSLTGWYYHLSRYGESIWRPTLAGLVIVFLSTLFWLIQINPSAEPSFTNTVGFANATKITVWQRAFERSMADFLPLLSIGVR